MTVYDSPSILPVPHPRQPVSMPLAVVRLSLSIERSMTDNGDGTCRVEATCPLCGQPAVVETVPKQAWETWAAGRGPFAVHVFTTLTADERETLISGAHGSCFDLAFPEEMSACRPATDRALLPRSAVLPVPEQADGR